MVDNVRAQHQAELERLRKEHAAEIVLFLEDLTSGDWKECLDIALSRSEQTNGELWDAVIQNLNVLIRQEAQRPALTQGLRAHDKYDDELPF